MPKRIQFAILTTLFAAATGGPLRNLMADEGIAYFETHIRPVLVENCYECHSAGAARKENLKGNLRIDTRAGIRAGGDTGPAVVPGNPEDSALMAAIRHESFEMPPQGKLPEHVIAKFAKWIKMGAPDPRDSSGVPIASTPNLEQARQWWAFQPPMDAQPPTVNDNDWPLSDIDRFILAELEAANLAPVADAEPRVLLRRLYFDLIGLPPTPEEVEAFLMSDDRNRIETVVDRLLGSPHFGERWGRHWMDVIRYADSVGGGANVVFDDAWRYRDYIIRSWNDDKPYDRFIMEQVAGDLLPSNSDAQQREQLIATGFLALGPKELAEYDMDQLQWDTVDEQLDTLGKSLMGMTLGCARCHDHKFDPVPTRDYYALAGIFRSTETLKPKRSGVIVQWTRLPLPGTGAERAPGVSDAPNPSDSRICVRGNKDVRGQSVPRGFLQAIQLKEEPKIDPQQSGRLQLAQWLTDPNHPLTARVFVNRVWQHLLGEGLVRTPDNYGTRGERPTHPQLLDHLTVDFTAGGWSLKELVRRIVLSRVYQLSSRPQEGAMQVDPDNRLLWRQNRRRLEAEAIRDAMLAVSGRLDRAQFGNTLTYTGRIDTPATDKKTNRQPWRRRSVYLPSFREAYENDLLKIFDAAHPALVTGRRAVTSVPTQALFLLNSPFVMEQAEYAALSSSKKYQASAGDDSQRVQAVYRRIVGRRATEQEVARDLELLNQCRAAFSKEPAGETQSGEPWTPDFAAWSCLCQTLLVSNEFLFVD